MRPFDLSRIVLDHDRRQIARQLSDGLRMVYEAGLGTLDACRIIPQQPHARAAAHGNMDQAVSGRK